MDGVLGVLEDWLATLTVAEAITKLRPLGLAVFPANSGKHAANDALVRGGMAFDETRSGVMVKGFPFQFEHAAMRIYEESPRMGEHTPGVLKLLAQRDTR